MTDAEKRLISRFRARRMSVPKTAAMGYTEILEECNCEFDPYDDGDTEESWHFKRTCEFCQNTWYGLHCPHDGVQNPCPDCQKRPTVILTC